MSETKAGKMRRAIVASDAAEIRARVARFEDVSPDRVAVTISEDEHGDVFAVRIDGADVTRAARWYDVTAPAAGLYLTARDGWEIEVRLELPAPWRWHPIGAVSVAICRSFDDAAKMQWIASVCDAGAYDARWYVFASPGSFEHLAKGDAVSLAEARERAEDECFARDLFGVADAPPVATTEPTDAPRDPAHEATIADLEAQIAGLVARLATVTEERDEATREVASWKDEHGHMHSDRDRQRKRVTELLDQLWATKAERDAARTNETDAGHRIATMEKALAQATAERDEARLNVVDARAHRASWKARAEDAEDMVARLRAVLAESSPKEPT